MVSPIICYSCFFFKKTTIFSSDKKIGQCLFKFIATLFLKTPSDSLKNTTKFLKKSDFKILVSLKCNVLLYFLYSFNLKEKLTKIFFLFL